LTKPFVTASQKWRTCIFVANEVYARRVRQLGEDPQHIYNVGSPALDFVKRVTLMSRGELEKTLGFQFKGKKLVWFTFHPATLETQP